MVVSEEVQVPRVGDLLIDSHTGTRRVVDAGELALWRKLRKMGLYPAHFQTTIVRKPRF